MIMIDIVRPAGVVLGLFTLLTGIVYPSVVTGAAQLAFPKEANGSLIERNGRVLGSSLIGQEFHGSRYFWGRPSATAPAPYDGRSSGGSNLGPTNPALGAIVKGRVAKLRSAHPDRGNLEVPVDLVTASASGLDPHISPAAALYQVSRIARVRGLPEERVRALVGAHLEGRTLGLLGEPRVNVLQLNIALDGLAAAVN
jgi:K+-transporting ATPase ATPase C chain